MCLNLWHINKYEIKVLNYRSQCVETQIEPGKSTQVGECVDPQTTYVVSAKIQDLELGQSSEVCTLNLL